MNWRKRYWVVEEGRHLMSKERDQIGHGHYRLGSAVRKAESNKVWYPDNPIKVVDFKPTKPAVVYVAQGVEPG